MPDTEKTVDRSSEDIRRWEVILAFLAIAMAGLAVGAYMYASSDLTCTKTTDGTVTTRECALTSAEATLVALPIAAAGFLLIPLVMHKVGLSKAGGLERPINAMATGTLEPSMIDPASSAEKYAALNSKATTDELRARIAGTTSGPPTTPTAPETNQ